MLSCKCYFLMQSSYLLISITTAMATDNGRPEAGALGEAHRADRCASALELQRHPLMCFLVFTQRSKKNALIGWL